MLIYSRHQGMDLNIRYSSSLTALAVSELYRMAYFVCRDKYRDEYHARTLEDKTACFLENLPLYYEELEIASILSTDYLCQCSDDGHGVCMACSNNARHGDELYSIMEDMASNFFYDNLVLDALFAGPADLEVAAIPIDLETLAITISQPNYGAQMVQHVDVEVPPKFAVGNSFRKTASNGGSRYRLAVA